MTEDDEGGYVFDLGGELDAASGRAGRNRKNPGNPYGVAQEFIAEWLGERLVWRGNFYKYAGSHWAIEDTNDVMVEVNRELGGSTYEKYDPVKDRTITLDWSPNNTSLANVKTQLLLQSSLHSTVEPDKGSGFIFLPEGRYHIDTGVMLDHDMSIFNIHASPVSYDVDAEAPTWMEFLDDTFGGNQDAIDLHGYWMAYELTGRTDLQKFYYLMGETRSGKGTIFSIGDALLGAGQVTALSLGDFAKDFGLANLIGRTACRISDAQDVDKKSASQAVHWLKTITGEDPVQINRKGVDLWVGRLSTRFTIDSNGPLDLPDPSGVVYDRAVLNKTHGTHKDRVDPGLRKRIVENEMSGVLNWVLQYADKLDGGWPVNDGAMETKHRMKQASQPLAEWAEDCGLVVGPEHTISRSEAYALYVSWSKEVGTPAADRALFGRNLRLWLPALRDTQPLVDGKQVRTYQGLGLAE